MIYGMQKESPRVVVRLDPSLKQQAERIAAIRDETLSQVLRRALREYVKQHAQLELPIKPAKNKK